MAENRRERVFMKNGLAQKKYFFCVVKNVPHEIENTREIIENMSEIF